MRSKGKHVNDVLRFSRQILKMLTHFPIYREQEDADGNVTNQSHIYNMLATFEQEGWVRSPEMAVYKIDLVEGRWFTDKSRETL